MCTLGYCKTNSKHCTASYQPASVGVRLCSPMCVSYCLTTIRLLQTYKNKYAGVYKPVSLL